jgi:molecular chaperone GrpE
LQKFAKDLVSSIDNFEHALRGVPAEKINSPPSAASNSAEYSPEALHKDLVNLHKGLELTESAMLSTLKRHGITRFDPSEAGEKFDPNTQEAVFHAPMQGKEDGTVFHTQQKGFLLNGRVLRVSFSQLD